MQHHRIMGSSTSHTAWTLDVYWIKGSFTSHTAWTLDHSPDQGFFHFPHSMDFGRLPDQGFFHFPHSMDFGHSTGSRVLSLPTQHMDIRTFTASRVLSSSHTSMDIRTFTASRVLSLPTQHGLWSFYRIKGSFTSHTAHGLRTFTASRVLSLPTQHGLWSFLGSSGVRSTSHTPWTSDSLPHQGAMAFIVPHSSRLWVILWDQEVLSLPSTAWTLSHSWRIKGSFSSHAHHGLRTWYRIKGSFGTSHSQHGYSLWVDSPDQGFFHFPHTMDFGRLPHQGFFHFPHSMDFRTFFFIIFSFHPRHTACDHPWSILWIKGSFTWPHRQVWLHDVWPQFFPRNTLSTDPTQPWTSLCVHSPDQGFFHFATHCLKWTVRTSVIHAFEGIFHFPRQHGLRTFTGSRVLSLPTQHGLWSCHRDQGFFHFPHSMWLRTFTASRVFSLSKFFHGRWTSVRVG